VREPVKQLPTNSYACAGGAGVGTADGAGVGAADGAGVGAVVGAADGAGVGIGARVFQYTACDPSARDHLFNDFGQK